MPRVGTSCHVWHYLEISKEIKNTIWEGLASQEGHGVPVLLPVPLGVGYVGFHL